MTSAHQLKTRHGPNGTHLFDRRTGLNILLDEVQPAEALWAEAPRYVSFALTNACELACSFCYAAKHPARLRGEDVVAWAEELDRAGCFGIGFGGGEPTLFPRFADLCGKVHDQTGLAVTLTTHGHRFTDELGRRLKGSVDFIRVSMDGIGRTYERIRGRSFADLEDRLSIIRSTAPFGINYVVNDDTASELAAAAEFAARAGAAEFLILPELQSNGAPRLSSEALTAATFWASENHERFRLATSGQGAALMNLPFLPVGTLQEGQDFMHVDASATLKLSAFEADGLPLKPGSSIMRGVRRLRTSGCRQRSEGERQ
jgi:sulfatase maturation enzyme AslB (radical SAM superfamily)